MVVVPDYPSIPTLRLRPKFPEFHRQLTCWAVLLRETTTDLRNGFVMADVVSLRTLLIKIPGLMLSVAAGGSGGEIFRWGFP